MLCICVCLCVPASALSVCWYLTSYIRLCVVCAGVLTSLSFGVASAFAGQVLAFPLETIAKRLQVCDGDEAAFCMIQAGFEF